MSFALKPVFIQTKPYFCCMTEVEIMQIQNEIFTKLVIDTLKQQRTDGVPVGDYLLDKYEIDKLTAERLKKMLAEERIVK